MKIINTKSLKFLEEYLNNAAPTGYESNGQKIWMKYLKPYVDEFITDNYGTAVGVINPDKKFKVVIEGHSDEISWYVNYITDNGLIYVIRNGGSDHQIAPSKWVNIHTKKGMQYNYNGFSTLFYREKKALKLGSYVLHGLRHTAGVALAEVGCTEKEIMAITGHETSASVRVYIKKANQKRLARSAIHKLESTKRD